MLRAHKWSIKQPLLCPNIVGGVAGWSGGALSLSLPRCVLAGVGRLVWRCFLSLSLSLPLCFGGGEAPVNFDFSFLFLALLIFIVAQLLSS